MCESSQCELSLEHYSYLNIPYIESIPFTEDSDPSGSNSFEVNECQILNKVPDSLLEKKPTKSTGIQKISDKENSIHDILGFSNQVPPFIYKEMDDTLTSSINLDAFEEFNENEPSDETKLTDTSSQQQTNKEYDSALLFDPQVQETFLKVQENFETFLTSDEGGQIKLYLGPFTKKQKVELIDFETNQLKPLSNINAIQNGLIIEIYHYWTKQKYKIARLCQWIRCLCPHPLNFSDPSLYVKVKNLMKAKHKQIIRTRTKKFAGCYRNFQYSPFFKSENFTEEIIEETPKEKSLRLELKKAEKTLNKQGKEISRKDIIIKSLEYDLSKMTEEMNSVKEELKSIKKEKKILLLKFGIERESQTTLEDTSDEMIIKKKRKPNNEILFEKEESKQQLKRKSREKSPSKKLIIEDSFSISPNRESMIKPEKAKFQSFKNEEENKGKRIHQGNFNILKQGPRIVKREEEQPEEKLLSNGDQFHDITKFLKIKIEPLSLFD